MATTKPKQIHKFAHSIRQLAKLVGRSHVAVSRWVKDDRWPFRRKPPWDPAAVRTWARANLMPEPGSDAYDGYVAKNAAERRADEERTVREYLGADALRELDQALEEAMKDFGAGR